MKGVPSSRQLKVGELIKRALSEIFAPGFLDVELFNMVSFTEARVNADLQSALVFVDSLNNIDAVLRELEKHKNAIRRELARRVDLKFIPNLNFKADKSAEYAKKIEDLIASPEVQQTLDQD